MADLQGYKCEFIDLVPDDFLCNKCALVARKLTVTGCCGESYCYGCIADTHLQGKTCPECGQQSFNIYEQVKYQRRMRGFKVYCTMKRRGCGWSETLEQLDAHLDPEQDNCQHVDTKCPLNCQQTIPKNKVEQHVAEECVKRDYVCQFCAFKASYEEVVDTHLPRCIYFPLQCPNLCGVTCERDVMEDHMRMCRLEEVACEFNGVGCDGRFIREDQEEHTRQNNQKHLTLTAAATVKTSLLLQQKLQEQEQKLQKQQQKLQEQEQKLQEQGQKLQEQEQKHQQEQNLEQKLQVQEKQKVQEQCQNLQEQEAKLQEQNKKVKKLETKLQEQEKKFQELEKKHETHKQKLEQKFQDQEKKFQEQEKKFQDLEKEHKQKLEQKFQEQEQKFQEQEKNFQELEKKHEAHKQKLEQKFQDQEKKFQEQEQKIQKLLQEQDKKVMQLQAKKPRSSATKARDTELKRSFIMENFSSEKRKDIQSAWKSPAMYTHLQGYKFCIGVDANGCGDARGKAIRMELWPMKGEFDDQLKWPVTVKFTLELANQQKGKSWTYTTTKTWERSKDSNTYYNFERIKCGSSYALMLHTELDDYLCNDELHAYITSLTVY